MCPNCGARLPRCAVCDFWVGEVDPHSRGARARARAKLERKQEREEARKANGQRDGEGKGEGEGEGGGGGEGDADETLESGKGKKLDDEEIDELMEGFIEICLGCRHVYHRRHAREWFGMHDECAVVGCRCLCGMLDGSFEERVRRS